MNAARWGLRYITSYSSSYDDHLFVIISVLPFSSLFSLHCHLLDRSAEAPTFSSLHMWFYKPPTPHQDVVALQPHDLRQASEPRSCRHSMTAFGPLLARICNDTTSIAHSLYISTTSLTQLGCFRMTLWDDLLLHLGVTDRRSSAVSAHRAVSQPPYLPRMLSACIA